jgi:ADP-ribosyl-[dinitrogen reductase] hydrolase
MVYTSTKASSNAYAISQIFMPLPKTSMSHPLRIDPVAADPACGRIGMTFCPGKKQSDARTGVWDRSLESDLEAIKAFGAAALVTLMPDAELQSLRVSSERIRDKASELGIEWYQLPIPDQGIPDQDFETSWTDVEPHLLALLRAGSNIVIHCKGGLGRTGTIAARLLIAFGADPNMAVQSVRNARPGAIENSRQEQYVLATLRKQTEGT